MPEPATLRAVARLAGVSLSTASQALNNKPNVAPETRARVLEAATALGYQQQVRIASPIAHKLSIIGLITRTTPDSPMTVNPFYAYVLAGAERECQRHNLSLMYTNIEVDDLNRPLARPAMLVDKRVDAVMVVGTLLPEFIEELQEKPVVLVDAYAPGQPVDSVVTDNLNGAHAAVTHLIEQGHRHIGLLGSRPDAYPSIRERRKGYMRALKQHGITDTYIRDGPLIREEGYDGLRALLNQYPQITAVFACNDLVAIGALDAARDMGIDVPGQLSLIGFDDIELTLEVKPRLTTVRVDKPLMGAVAVRLLRDRAEDPDRATMSVVIGTRLVERDSVHRLKH